MISSPSNSWIETAELHPQRLDSSFYHDNYIANERNIRACPAPLATIRDLSTRVFKGAFYVLSSEYCDSGIPFLRILDIKPGFVDANGCVHLPPETHARERGTAVKPNDFLIAKTGASIGYSAVVPLWLREANICQDLVGVRLRNGLDPYYLQGFISSNFGRIQADRWRQGNAHPHLGNDGIREWLIPTPTEDVQIAIGNKVRKAERLRELATARNTEVAAAVTSYLGDPPSEINSHASWVPTRGIYSRLDSSYFAATVVETVTVLNDRFDAIPLSRLVATMCTGSTPAELSNAEGIPFFPSGAVGTDYLTDEANLFISAKDHEQRTASQTKPEDILCAKDGNTIGHLAVVPRWATNGNINEHTYLMRLVNPGISIWIHAFLVSEWGRRQILREAVGSAQAGLGRAFIDNVLVVAHPDSSVMERVQSQGMRALDELQEAKEVMMSVHTDIRNVVSGDDWSGLLGDSEDIATWLRDNPSPRARK